MRKLRWPIGILTTLIAIAATIALRKPPDDYADLKPYAVGDDTQYISSKIF